MSDQILTGRTVAVPESRELDTLADMLRSHGASVVSCPLVAILDAPDPAPVEAWLHELAAGTFDDVILFTGEGVQRLLDCATRAGILDKVVEALTQTRTITRGPKPARALTRLGLKPKITAKNPTTAGIMESLVGEDLAGRRIGVQLYGTEPNETLMSFLRGGGATVLPVAPYIYAPASDDARVLQLIADLAGGAIDAIAFTSASQIDRLFAVASLHHASSRLFSGLAHTRVAAVGPVVAASLEERGVTVHLTPARNYFMKPLVNELLASLGSTRRTSVDAA